MVFYCMNNFFYSFTAGYNIINNYNFFTFNRSEIGTYSSFAVVFFFSVFVRVVYCKGSFNSTHVF